MFRHRQIQGDLDFLPCHNIPLPRVQISQQWGRDSLWAGSQEESDLTGR